MATKTVIARLEGDGLRLAARTGSGHTIVMDSAEGGSGARPAEMLRVAMAGCTAMDVVSILRLADALAVPFTELFWAGRSSRWIDYWYVTSAK